MPPRSATAFSAITMPSGARGPRPTLLGLLERQAELIPDALQLKQLGVVARAHLLKRRIHGAGPAPAGHARFSTGAARTNYGALLADREAAAAAAIRPTAQRTAKARNERGGKRW